MNLVPSLAVQHFQPAACSEPPGRNVILKKIFVYRTDRIRGDVYPTGNTRFQSFGHPRRAASAAPLHAITGWRTAAFARISDRGRKAISPRSVNTKQTATCRSEALTASIVILSCAR